MTPNIKKIYFFLLIQCLGLSQWAIASSTETTIQLIDQISIRAPGIELTEIAKITSSNPKVKKELSNLHLGDAPRIGSSKTVSAYSIKALLNKNGFKNISVTGTNSRVSTEVRTIESNEIERHIHNWITKQLGENNEIEINYLKIPQKWRVPAGENLEIALKSNNLKSKVINLSLQAIVQGTSFSNTHARIQTKQFGLAPVLIRPLLKGEKVSMQDVEMRKAEITHKSGMNFTNIDDAIGLIAKRNLPVGTSLSTTDLTEPKVISRGTQTRIMVINGPVKMSLSGAVALQDGKKGEEILFQHPIHPKETLKATVLRKGTAVIKLQ